MLTMALYMALSAPTDQLAADAAANAEIIAAGMAPADVEQAKNDALAQWEAEVLA
jgi:hypothetical protein